MSGQPVKTCVTCAHSRATLLYYYCQRPICAASYVDGKPVLLGRPCDDERADKHKLACGPVGRHWQPIPAKPSKLHRLIKWLRADSGDYGE